MTASAASEQWSPKTIVVGYDGTQSAEQALTRAIALARRFSSQLVVADVAAPEPLPEATPGTPGAFGFVPYPYEPDSQASIEERVWQQHRSHIAELLAQAGVEHKFAQLVGEPVAEIVETAMQADADLIVVGTHEPRFFERLLRGSVSHGVASHAHCDVLIVHSARV